MLLLTKYADEEGDIS